MPVASGRRLLGLALPPGEQFAAELEAAWARGEAVLPIDPSAPRATFDAVVDALRPHAVLGTDGLRRFDGVDVDPDVALVIATSGSTGVPKGAQLSHAALEASARATMRRIGVSDGDRWLACLPWQHIGGLQVLLRSRLFGTPLEVHPSFDVHRVASCDATLVSLVPTQLVRLLDSGVDLRRFRVILLGGAAAPPGLLDRAHDAGAPVVATYGMSETAGGCVYDGTPLDGVEVRVDDGDGRILLRGSMLMSGYRLRPDLTSAALVDGWLRTDDTGAFDSGRLLVHGRLDDVIVTGGENVVATHVAGVLAEHPAVADVAVAGVPDEHWGRRVVAIVVPRADPPTLGDLREWMRGRAAAASAPRALVLVDAIPRLVSGKPDRLALERLAQAAPTATSQSADPPSVT